MSEMVERVARAIFNASLKSVGRGVVWTAEDVSWPAETIRDEARQCARAAIAAMREPTLAMIAEGNACDDIDSGRAGAAEHWQAMIDAALEQELEQ